MNAFLETQSNIKYEFKENADIPNLKNDSFILVKVYSTSLNHIDTILLLLRIPIARWFRFSHYGIASDFSGKIVQIGENPLYMRAKASKETV